MADGWCEHCARSRGIVTAALLFILGPILGVGACTQSIHSPLEELGWALGWLGMAAPLLALFIFARAMTGMKR